jgi:hypothetical protein
VSCVNTARGGSGVWLRERLGDGFFGDRDRVARLCRVGAPVKSVDRLSAGDGRGGRGSGVGPADRGLVDSAWFGHGEFTLPHVLWEVHCDSVAAGAALRMSEQLLQSLDGEGGTGTGSTSRPLRCASPRSSSPGSHQAFIERSVRSERLPPYESSSGVVDPEATVCADRELEVRETACS